MDASAAPAQNALLLRPPHALDPWLSAGIGVAFDGAAGDLQCHFPAVLGSGLVLVLEGALGLHDGMRLHPLPAAFVSGPATSPVTLYRTPRLRCIAVMVRPAGAAALLGDTPEALVDGIADARAVFGPRWNTWMERIGHARGDAARIGRLFDFVWDTVGGEQRHAARRISGAQLQHAALRGTPGTPQTGGYSRRHFERLFSAHFGLRPKLFQRLARTEAALRDLLAGGCCGADLAMRHGYFDQSHLGRDLRAFAGAPAGTLLSAVQASAPAYWPLLVGASYGRAGLRADFGDAVSHFS
ncbi:helix-turn-helix domain-containing protein [Ramlibacter sp.]|uniref:helix-turn-helix domain-containing protein n=1 Tax=Ramlibacter sp. TaxID=1917967 RepID=UPI00185AD503|nr:helix-turn-helix domain-containing protein [Ramlibacter sp.]MBA2676472.1 AraC family transcriptional regulator [Ramlibacter sp.]